MFVRRGHAKENVLRAAQSQGTSFTAANSVNKMVHIRFCLPKKLVSATEVE